MKIFLTRAKHAGIFCALIFLFSTAFPQDYGLQSVLPVDPSVKTGKFDNGMTYYIRYNAKPEKRIEFRLAVKAGSICETDQQLGLAHFVEHMCFNGTKNFKENELVNALEEMGVKFGANLNAYTGFDETVYQLQVPSDRPDLVEKGFQVMEDWAHQVTFADKDIDEERDVIVEEWRLGLGAQDRMQKKYFPIILKGSRYANRMPIGDINIVKNTPYETLRSFYRDWYRPDLMAIAVVGDMDTAFVRKKITEHFSPIQNPSDKKIRVPYDIPGNRDPLVAIVTDKEATYSTVEMYIKHPKKIEKTVGDYRDMLSANLYNGMFNMRLSELMQNPDAPYITAGSGYSGFLGPLDAYALYAIAKENQINESFKNLLTETERIKQHGFTQTELDRMKSELLTLYEQHLKEADKRESETLISELMRNFLEDEPVPGIQKEADYAKKFLPEITLDEVNRLTGKWLTDENICLVVTAPDKSGIKTPTANELIQILHETKNIAVDPYIDQVSDEPLFTQKPERGRVLRRRDIPEFGVVELTFVNGVQAILKPTSFQNDQILFSGFSPGGTSLYVDEDYMSAMLASSIVTMSGLGNFDQISLNKKLAGSTASVSPYINELYEGVRGSAAPKDLETLLQLNYMYFTETRRDETAFNTLMSQLRNQISNMRANPAYAYTDTLNKVVSGNSPRVVTIPTERQLNSIRLDNALYIFKDRFADAGDFKFVMVGNFDTDQIVPLLEQYLGGLPSRHRVESWRNVLPVFPKGINKFEYAHNSEPQSRVNIIMRGDFKWKYRERIGLAIMSDILNIKLRETMREEQGGVYGVRLNESVSVYPKPRYSLDFSWGCAPENVDTLIHTVFAEAEKIKKNGPAEADMKKVRETLIRDRETMTKENSYWYQVLENLYSRGDKLMTLEEYKKAVESVKPKDIRNAARKYFNESNYVIGVLMPVN